MTKIWACFSFLLLSAICFTSPAKAQHINLNALEAYWKLTDRLRQGDTISRIEWKDFLQMDGNRQYVANQGFDAQFLENYRKYMQLVYMPQYADKVKKMMEQKFSYWIAYKIFQYQSHEAALRAYATHLKDEAYLDSMYKNTWSWLPKKLQTKSPSTNIYFIGIDNDAIAQGDTIVFTTWSAYNMDQLKYGILGGHELHHVLRKQPRFNKIEPNDEGIVYVLLSVLNEGSADMVDKNYDLKNLKSMPPEFQYDDILLTKPDSIIRQIDTSMQVMKSTAGKQFKTVREYRKLINYSSGHDPGYYMANIIVRNGYKKELLKNIQNPFYFICLYNKAAKKDKANPPVFSAAAIEYCKTLERKYLAEK